MTQTPLEALETYFAIEDMARGKVSDRTLSEIVERRKELRQALTGAGEPVARLHVTETDSYLDVSVEVLNGERLQPSMSPIAVYTSPQTPTPDPDTVTVRREDYAWLLEIANQYEAGFPEDQARLDRLSQALQVKP